MSKTPITVAHGDGIGPEIMSATLRILQAAGAELDIEEVEIGERLYLAGSDTGIRPDAWAAMQRTGVLLKGPVTTPQGGGFKSLNVTARKTLGLYANVRPCVAYAPFVATRHPGMDVVIVRENEEDLYAGIEHRQTADVVQCLKLVSRPGCERIVRYAFEYARCNGRRKVTCLVKDNIMKMTDGLLHRVFDEIGAAYPDIERDTLIVDIGAARLADRPTDFDVIVTTNLYGDILSDVAAQIAGSVGMAGSANIGTHCAMFEAIHGSAPTLAGKDVANPSGLLQAAVMMLQHIGQGAVAERVANAWLRALEDGVHTADIYDPAVSAKKVGTQDFADAVIARLGRLPEVLQPVRSTAGLTRMTLTPPRPAQPVRKDWVGVDVFLDWRGGSAEQLGHMVKELATTALPLLVITNRGVKVYPGGLPQTLCVDHWRCRFLAPQGSVQWADLALLLDRLHRGGLDVIKLENLYRFDGQNGYAAVHG